MEQSSAFVTVFAGNKCIGKPRAKTRAKPAFDRTHRHLIRAVMLPEIKLCQAANHRGLDQPP
jgi:hypothetical protein